MTVGRIPTKISPRFSALLWLLLVKKAVVSMLEAMEPGKQSLAQFLKVTPYGQINFGTLKIHLAERNLQLGLVVSSFEMLRMVEVFMIKMEKYLERPHLVTSTNILTLHHLSINGKKFLFKLMVRGNYAHCKKFLIIDQHVEGNTIVFVYRILG